LLNEQATDTTMLSFSDFAVGDSVVAVIRKGNDGELTIVRLSKVDTQTQTFILGVPSVIDTVLSTLTLFNQTIQTDNAVFYDSNQDSLSQAGFFSSIDPQSDVLITGQVRSGGVIDASRLEQSDF
ncbi:MAG: hypothetical protein ACPG47_11180, partial [Leucothrix sp.]